MLEINEFLRTYWPILAGILTLLMAGGGALLLRTFVTKEEHVGADRVVHKRISVTQKEIAVLAKAVENLPNQDDFKDLYGGIEALTATSVGLNNAVTKLDRSVSMLIENELKGEKK